MGSCTQTVRLTDRMKKGLLSVVTVLLFSDSIICQTAPEFSCCPVRTVSSGDLQGRYEHLGEEYRASITEECDNGCVYRKEGDSEGEYCFRRVPLDQAPITECQSVEVTTSKTTIAETTKGTTADATTNTGTT